MILVSPPYRTNWGCLLADSGTIRREVTRPVAGRPSMFVLRSMRKHPRDFLADVSVNHSRTGAVKLLITRRTSQSSKLPQGYRSPDYSLSPAAATGLRSSPRSKRMTRPCASRTLLSSCLRGQCRLTLWGTLERPGRADVAPPRPFRRSQLCTLCWPALLRPAISGALSTRPQRRRRRWPDSKK